MTDLINLRLFSDDLTSMMSDLFVEKNSENFKWYIFGILVGLINATDIGKQNAESVVKSAYKKNFISEKEYNACSRFFKDQSSNSVSL